MMGNKILYGIAIICWMLVIFSFSGRNSVESTQDSRGLISNTVEVCANFAYKLGITKEKPSESDITSIVRKLDHPIRKMAHGTVYFVLALLIMLALDTNTDNYWRNAGIAVLCCFIYAMTDEFHQTFIPGRSGEFKDCLIDTSGAVMACCIYGIGVEMIRRHN